MHGKLSHVWFDRYKISRDCPEHLKSIEEMCSNLGAVVQDEIRSGVPKHRIIIGMAAKFFSDYASPFVSLLLLCTILNTLAHHLSKLSRVLGQRCYISPSLYEVKNETYQISHCFHVLPIAGLKGIFWKILRFLHSLISKYLSYQVHT